MKYCKCKSIKYRRSDGGEGAVLTSGGVSKTRTLTIILNALMVNTTVRAFFYGLTLY